MKPTYFENTNATIIKSTICGFHHPFKVNFIMMKTLKRFRIRTKMQARLVWYLYPVIAVFMREISFSAMVKPTKT
ncbi:MAG: hypothetical protein ABIJ16_04395 [Bacteroidota bacterium]